MEVVTSIREDDGKTEVTVTMAAEEVKVHIDAYFKELSKSRIPGFRPGRAPRKVLEQNFGGHEYIYAQITSDAVNDTLPIALDEQGIIFISEPEFDEEMPPVHDGQDYTFKAYGSVKPVVELSSYDPVSITMPDVSVKDEEVEEQITALQGYYYDIIDVERPALATDYVIVNIQATLDGKDVAALACKERLVDLSSPALPVSVNAQLVGMAAGETKEFDAVIDEKEAYETLRGEEVHVKASVSQVRAKQLPELDDAFAEKVGFDSMELMRKQVREQVEYQKTAQYPDLKERRCIDAIAERVQGDISEEYVAYVRQDILRDFFSNLQQQDTSFDQFLAAQGITADEFQADLDKQAQESAAQGLALDALVSELGLVVSDEDIDAEFAKVQDEDITREAWEKAGRMSELREAMSRQKASEWLLENAVITVEQETQADDAGPEAGEAQTAEDE